MADSNPCESLSIKAPVCFAVTGIDFSENRDQFIFINLDVIFCLKMMEDIS